MTVMGKAIHALALAAVAMTGSGGIAQTAPQSAWPPAGVSYDGDPAVADLSGLWLGTVMAPPGSPAANNTGKTADGRPPLYLMPWPLPYTPRYQKIVEERAGAEKAGKALGDIGARCLPFGLPVMLLNKNYPDEIVQTPGEVTFFVFGTFPITIWTDGRPHPADWKPSYNGHSIGYWVGDTLFVDTIGILATTPVDGLHDPHSDKLHLKWSLRRVAPDKLHVNITLFDDEAFTEPVTTTNIFDRKKDKAWEVLDDASCFENASSFSDKTPDPGFIRF